MLRIWTIAPTVKLKSKILANETPVPLYDNAKIALHLIPIASFNPAQTYEIQKIASDPIKIPTICQHGTYGRYNLDGFLVYSLYQDGTNPAYTQLYRNGTIEAVDGYTLRKRGDSPLIPSISYEKNLIESLQAYISVLNLLSVDMPIFIFLTLLGVKGYSMGIDRGRYEQDEVNTIDRDILQLPEVILETLDVDSHKVLRPCFDSIWNACGFPKDFYYNDSGKWVPK